MVLLADQNKRPTLAHGWWCRYHTSTSTSTNIIATNKIHHDHPSRLCLSPLRAQH